MSNNAEHLIKLIDGMADALNIKIGSASTLGETRLWQALSVISNHVGFSKYTQLVQKLDDLCSNVKIDANSISLSRESIRDRWLLNIDQINNVFDAENLPHASATIFSKHFQSAYKATLEEISDRISSSGYKDSSIEELNEAFSFITDAIEELYLSDKISLRFRNLIKGYTEQMRSSIALYDIYGEGNFWRVYKETLATFLQLQEHISQSDNHHTIKEKFIRAAKKLSITAYHSLAIAGNVGTVTQVMYLLASSS